MGKENQFKERILHDWMDPRVARWVIGRLPLLERAFLKPSCPVFTLSVGGDLSQIDGEPINDFRELPKLVMSGGFEGTAAHVAAAEEMLEVKALSMPKNCRRVFLLEPDSYIIDRKKRDSIFDINERAKLWATSGLLDAVVILPSKPEGMETKEHYENIAKALSPAIWCSNPENPNWHQIITRMEEEQPFSLIRLFKNRPEVHTSFLAATRELDVKRVRQLLRTYVIGLLADPSIYAIARNLSPTELSMLAESEYARLSTGL